MKSFKNATVLFLVIVFLFILSITSFALDDSVYSVIEESGIEDVFENTDEDTKRILEELGLDETDMDSVFSISPKSIITELINIISGKISGPFRLFLNLIAIMIFQSVIQSIVKEDKNSVSSIVFILLLTTVGSVPAFKAVTLASSQMITSGGFMLSFVPVYAFLLSSSGNITEAVSFNSLLFAASEFIVQFIENYLLPVTGLLMSINIASAINPIFPLNQIISSFKKIIAVTLSFISTVFIGFLSFKGSIASSVDALTVRSIRTLSGSVIPFIGSSVADAYSSVLGSLKLVNNCFGFLGIITVFAINVPIIIELFLYYLSFHFAFIISETLKCESAKLLEGIASVISIINIILVFVSILFIVSLGIMLKAGVN